MNLVIDTNIIRKDRSFQRSEMLLLKKLATLNLVKLHIPWIVMQESITQNESDITDELNKAEKAIKSIKNKGLSSTDYDKIEEIETLIQSLKDEVKLSVKLSWDEFLELTNAKVHEIEDAHGKLVMNSYFEGNPPYSSLKNRLDIPDAFIFMSMKSISNKFFPINFISEDNNLKEHAKKLSNCNTYNTLTDFFESENFKMTKKQYEDIEHYSDDLIILKNNSERIKEKIINHIKGDIFTGDDQLVSKFDILLPENEGTIEDINDVSIIDLNLSKVRYINNIFYIPVEALGTFTIEYFIIKSEYNWNYPNKKISILDGNWNDHVMLMLGNFKLQMNLVFKMRKEDISSNNFTMEFEPLDEDSLTWSEEKYS